MRTLLCLALLTLSPSVVSAETLMTQESAYSVKETLDRLTALLESKGIKVAARIDHAENAKSVGMELPPSEVLLFGNPNAGTPLMTSNPTIGLDLPMRVLAWQDGAGKVRVTYTQPSELKARYAIKDREEQFKQMEGLLSDVVGQAARK